MKANVTLLIAALVLVAGLLTMSLLRGEEREQAPAEETPASSLELPAVIDLGEGVRLRLDRFDVSKVRGHMEVFYRGAWREVDVQLEPEFAPRNVAP